MIRAYLVDRVNVIDYTYDQWGEIATTTTTSKRARIDYRNTNVVNLNGEDVVCDKSVIMEDFNINQDAEIEIDGERFPIQSIQRPKDWTWAYLRVYLGKSRAIKNMAGGN